MDRISALDEAIRRFGQAWSSGETVTLDAMLSPTYTHIDASGMLLERAGWLEYARGRSGRASQIAFRDVATRILGDIAIVTGVNDLTGTGIRGQDDTESLTLRFTQVWVWRDERWLREAFQATPVPLAEKFA
jgi:hypothetical protein